MDAKGFLRDTSAGLDPVARALDEGMDPSEIKALLRLLEGSGYIERVRTEERECGTCPKRGSCRGLGQDLGLFSITEACRYVRSLKMVND